MIEPTETESKETMDAFANVMAKIAEEARTQPELLHGAPHNTPVTRLDETQAAVEMATRWAIPFGHTVTLGFQVTGNGTLALYEGATTIGTATSADGAKKLKYPAAQNPAGFRFVYTPGTGDTGGALLDGFEGTGGLLILLR